MAVSKNTYYRFLNETSYNWSRFLLLLAVRTTTAFNSLTRPERVKVLILDDSVIKRNRSKTVELLARVYDHVEHRCQKGFTLLTLGWSDGYSFIPTGFNMLSSTEKINRYNEVCSDIDHRTSGFRFRKESMMHNGCRSSSDKECIERRCRSGLCPHGHLVHHGANDQRDP